MHYDGFERDLSKDFKIGSPTAKIINVSAEPIINGTVGEIITKVRSYWDENIRDAYVNIDIKRGEYSASIKSASVTLKPWSDAEFSNYWDTSKAKGPGNYSARVTLHYLDKTDVKTVNLTVVLKKQEFPIQWILMVILLVVLISSVFYYRRRKGKFVQEKLTDIKRNITFLD
jgi:hypothetical protein